MRWIASLSTGLTVTENAPAPGELSPWQSLLQHLRENPQTSITQMRLQHDNLTLMSMPGARGYVQCGRLMVSGLLTGGQKERNYRGIGAVFGEWVYMTWLSIDDPQNILVYQSIEPLHELSIHAWQQASTVGVA